MEGINFSRERMAKILTFESGCFKSVFTWFKKTSEEKVSENEDEEDGFPFALSSDLSKVDELDLNPSRSVDFR